jgi:hypothetical protein
MSGHTKGPPHETQFDVRDIAGVEQYEHGTGTCGAGRETCCIQELIYPSSVRAAGWFRITSGGIDSACSKPQKNFHSACGEFGSWSGHPGVSLSPM